MNRDFCFHDPKSDVSGNGTRLFMTAFRFGMASILAAPLGLVSPAFAQSTSGVFGPTVNEGHRSAQYRIGYDPDTESHTQRVHYQQAINGDLRWRGIVQVRETDDSDFDFDYVRAELLWELSDDEDKWKRALRFDGRIRGDGRPALVALNWTNQFPITDRLRGRFITVTGVEIGDDADDGIALETRASLSYKLSGKTSIAVESFNSYGTTDEIPDFDEQEHQIGPSVSYKVTPDWSIYSGALFGVTDATADTELRLWISRGF